MIDATRLNLAIDATWPAAKVHLHGAWFVREGRGGGKRVSAASTTDENVPLAAMESAQKALGQETLVMVTEGQAQLDRRLSDAGYAVIDPVVCLTTQTERLCLLPDRLTAFEVALPPLAAQAEVWQAGGIGPARLDVMARANGPKVTLMGRSDDQPLATAFVACHAGVAMVHALEVAAQARRQGLGRALMQAAALWARRHRAGDLAVLVTRANTPALSLYRGLGMTEAGGYHYRIKRHGEDGRD